MHNSVFSSYHQRDSVEVKCSIGDGMFMIGLALIPTVAWRTGDRKLFFNSRKP